MLLQQPNTQIQRQPLQISWLPPIVNSYKLNSDGSSIWEMNLFMVTWVCVVLHPSSIHAEGYGILRGLGKRHHAFGLRNRLKKKKKKMAIDLILLSHKRLHPYHPLFQQIRHFQSLDCQFSFQHFYRQGNMCTADGLAKVGSSISKILRL